MLLLITFLGIRYYINSHKEEFAVKLEKILNENQKGIITLDSIAIGSITKFPNIEVDIYNLKLVDSLYQFHNRETVFLQEVGITISIIDALKKELNIKTVRATKGKATIFVDEDHYTNTYVFGANSRKKKQEKTIKVSANDSDIILEDIEFLLTEKIKNQRFSAHINKIDFNLDVSKFKIKEVNLDVFMKEMGFNLEKGTFFNNARCIGSFQPIINKELHSIEIPNFDLNIDEQLFDVSAKINTKTKLFTFLIGLKKLKFNETKQLLAANIQSRLEDFEIVKPFDVKAEISGKFEYRNLTYVKLNFNTTNNEIIYKKDSLDLKNIDFKGSFINRFYLDSNQISKEKRKNYTLAFDSLTGTLKDIPFKLSNVSVKSDYPKPLLLDTDYEVSGEINAINDFIKSSDYHLDSGTFNINGSYSGVLKSLDTILKTSKLNLEIADFIVKSKKNRTLFNIPILNLHIENDDANIRNLTVQFGRKEKLRIKGDIKNFSTLVSNNKANIPTVATVNISSNYLNFNTILKTFGTHKKNTESKNLSDIKKSIHTLAKKFNPSISFKIKQLDFFEIPFKNVNLDLQYQKNNIEIKNISGNYKNGGANASINLGLNPLKNNKNQETLQLEIAATVFGKIEHWAEMLHNENFFFKDADYSMKIHFSDKASTFTDFIDKSNILLNINKGTLFYKPSKLTLPFAKISINIKNRNAYLNDFELILPENQSLHLRGKVTNFVAIFDQSISTYNTKSSITLSSNNINFSNFVSTFNPSNLPKSKKQNNIKVILNELYTKFNPSLKLDFKKLSYKNITLDNVNATLLFEDKNTLHLKNTYCYFHNKRLSLDAKIDIQKPSETIFQTHFTIDNFAIEHLLESFDNFGYKSLDDPTHTSGTIHLKANFSGAIDDEKGVDFDSLKAFIDFEIDHLNLNNFQPIIDAGNIVFRKSRFEKIKFSNIKSNITLENKNIKIPPTAVQSTAFEFFIEGILDNTNNTDLWISIPLSNIKRRDLTKVPKKKTIDEAGKKIFLEIISDKNGKLKHKLRFSNKKYLKHKEY